uniref:HAT C-terminal dimerisation domain-containing protein n=1 Tax=Oryza barthii TaxID=65489 RepID=A0A0D3FZQ4_9ORYZ
MAFAIGTFDVVDRLTAVEIATEIVDTYALDTTAAVRRRFVMESSHASSSSASICNAGIVALRASQPTLANVGDPTTNVVAAARVEVDLTQETTEDANVPPAKKAKKCSSESAFSAGGHVIDPFRSSLDPEIVQALIYTKDWTAASRKGGNVVGSILTEKDMENLERNF